MKSLSPLSSWALFVHFRSRRSRTSEAHRYLNGHVNTGARFMLSLACVFARRAGGRGGVVGEGGARRRV